MKLAVSILTAMMLMAGSAMAAVDINTATQSELESVKGLGPTKAKAIIAYREKNGPFKDVDELDKVKGFGKATINKLRSDLKVNEKTPASTTTK